MTAVLSQEAALATRRKKPKQLSEREIAELLVEAERFHDAICRPMIDPYCDHYRALLKLNEALHSTVRVITGREPPWITRGSLDPSRRDLDAA